MLAFGDAWAEKKSLKRDCRIGRQIPFWYQPGKFGKCRRGLGLWRDDAPGGKISLIPFSVAPLFRRGGLGSRVEGKMMNRWETQNSKASGPSRLLSYDTRMNSPP